VLRRALPGVTVTVSTRRTDPWTLGTAGSAPRGTTTAAASTAASLPPTMHDVIEGATQP
jgi:hypothetical protein